MFYKNFKNIDIRLFLIFVMGCFFSAEVCLLGTIFFIVLDIIKRNWKVSLNITFSFIIIWILGIIMSFYSNQEVSLHEFIRYSFYVLSPVIYIYFGYIIYRDNDMHTILKTICIAGAINSIQIIIQMLLNMKNYGITYNSLRSAKSKITDLMILLFFIYLIKKTNIQYISNKIDKILFGISIIILVVTFSRTHLLYFIIGLIIYSAFNWKSKKFLKILFAGIIFMSIISFIVLNNAVLHNFFKEYLEKIESSSTELSSNQNWGFVEINNSWRGYEIYQAKNQFNNGDIIQKIFGFGCKGTYVGKYATLVSTEAINGYLPVLHNGYYGMLIYSGIIGLIIYLLFFINQIILILNCNRIKDTIKILYMIIVVGSMATTYVVMGLVSSTSMVIYSCVMMGILKNHMINEKNKEKHD